VFVEQLRARWATSSARALAFHGALALLLVLGVLDQTSPAFVPAYDGLREQFASEAAFVGAIERSVPPGSMIFQLPWVPFPESVGVRQVWPYDLFRGYLHSHQLRWSFGAMQGRGPEWQRKVAEAPTDLLLARLAAGGSAAIKVAPKSNEDPPAPQAVERYAYSTLYPLEITWGAGFYGTETVAGAQSRWGANEAELSISNPGASARTVRLSMRLATGLDVASTVAVSGDLLDERLAVGQAPTSLSREVVVPPGVHRVRFQTDAPALTPAAGDPRRLVFRLIGFELVDADDVLVAGASSVAM
jgi:phosphoglycerol transferase